MSNHQRLSRRSMRVWMVANGLVLVALVTWILQPATTSPPPSQQVGPGVSTGPTDPATEPTPEPPPEPPTVADIMDIPGLRFGVSAPDVPWSPSEFQRIADAAEATPTLVQFFLSWEHDYPSETVEHSYALETVPVLSWEPWAGLDQGIHQPDYALARILDGDYDDYLRDFADDLRDHGWPVVIRFAHEMNGHWYPWSEQNSGNQLGEYATMWRYVHEIFTEHEVENVIWLWSPNIIRAVPEISLAALYPGDDYVDWIGMVGYAFEEFTAAETFQATYDTLRDFTDKPLLITETGAQPGDHKISWITDLFDWVSQRSDIVGLIWFEYTPADGGNADWRFTATPEITTAFRDGLARNTLADPPPL
ncbi:hypothetical protein JQS43_14000 [Natronosporangium hydrolyticum]|uniref:GH26 domain-containing protein n=1 Tax=Natronosporangium hydrolyticum TaxID=2811111 RepID=A0A895YGI3_9ACTN|nr:glycosyl hydrolase [Natronosporangium hydrolyticum]QSB12798.1 hypothetical protein JQS43_14000 [Natronosporangium hydrolyticum]